MDPTKMDPSDAQVLNDSLPERLQVVLSDNPNPKRPAGHLSDTQRRILLALPPVGEPGMTALYVAEILKMQERTVRLIHQGVPWRPAAKA